MIEIKEVVPMGAVKDDLRSRSREELHETRRDLQLASRQLINLRRQLLVYKDILEKEVGRDVDPEVLALLKPAKKKRAKEISYLQSELVDLVGLKTQADPDFRQDRDWSPSRLRTARGSLLSQKKLDQLRKLYSSYDVYSSDSKRAAAEAYQEYSSTKKDYESKLLQNKVLVEEIRAMRKRISNIRVQSQEDKCFMEFLVTYNVYREKQLPLPNTDSVQAQGQDTQPQQNADLEAENYKALLESSLQDKNDLQDWIHDLQERVEELQGGIARAETVCESNTGRFQDLERMLFSQGQPTKKGKQHRQENEPRKNFVSSQRHLQAAVNENKYVKSFLRREILATEPGFTTMHRSLEETVANCRAGVEEASAAGEEQEPPQPPTDEKPAKKGKKQEPSKPTTDEKPARKGKKQEPSKPPTEEKPAKKGKKQEPSKPPTDEKSSKKGKKQEPSKPPNDDKSAKKGNK